MDGDPFGEVDAGGGSQEGAHLVGEGVARARHEDEGGLGRVPVDPDGAAPFGLLQPVDDSAQRNVDPGSKKDGRGKGAEPFGNPVNTFGCKRDGVQRMAGGGGGRDGFPCHRIYPNGNPAGAAVNVHPHRNRSA